MPSTSEKQRRYMGMQLAKQRESGHNETGMSEGQLHDFASGPVKKSGRSQHGSLEDITFMEEAGTCDVVCGEGTPHAIHKGYKGKAGDLENGGAIVWGSDVFKFQEIGSESKDAAGVDSALRDVGNGIHMGAPVDYFGPDTNYRAEEIDPHQYGKDYDPIPLRDYFKTEDKMYERTFRVRSQDLYDETATPGVVTDDQPMSEAYGAVNFRGAGPNTADGEKAGSDRYRSFDEQRRFARTNKDRKQEYATDVSGLDTKEGDDIR
jgi:hypothetical protein